MLRIDLAKEINRIADMTEEEYEALPPIQKKHVHLVSSYNRHLEHNDVTYEPTGSYNGFVLNYILRLEKEIDELKDQDIGTRGSESIIM